MEASLQRAPRPSANPPSIRVRMGTQPARETNAIVVDQLRKSRMYGARTAMIARETQDAQNESRCSIAMNKPYIRLTAPMRARTISSIAQTEMPCFLWISMTFCTSS